MPGCIGGACEPFAAHSWSDHDAILAVWLVKIYDVALGACNSSAPSILPLASTYLLYLSLSLSLPFIKTRSFPYFQLSFLSLPPLYHQSTTTQPVHKHTLNHPPLSQSSSLNTHNAFHWKVCTTASPMPPSALPQLTCASLASQRYHQDHLRRPPATTRCLPGARLQCRFPH